MQLNRPSTNTVSMPLGRSSFEAAYRRGILRGRAMLSELTLWSARIETMEVLKVGMPLWITLPGLEARMAHVTWTEGFIAGVRFQAPLHPAILDAVLEGRLGRLH